MGDKRGRRPSVEERAGRHTALGDPVRLAIVDDLSVSDRSTVELRRRLGMESNLLAHHLDALWSESGWVGHRRESVVEQ